MAIKGNIIVKFGNLGLRKNTSWAFQNEWRYWLSVAPTSIEKVLNKRENVVNRIMPILLRPKISPGSRAIVELLREKYNPTMTIMNSRLQDTIR